MRICEIDGCGNKHHSRDWCHMHYTRWLKHGDTETVIPASERPRPPARTCDVRGCNRKHHAKGRCYRHYRAPAKRPPPPPGPDDPCRDCGGEPVCEGFARCLPCFQLWVAERRKREKAQRRHAGIASARAA